MENKKFTEEDILSDFLENLKINVTQQQKEYYWIRLYTNTEYDFKQGDIITLNHLPTGEKLDLMFTNFDKVGKIDQQSNSIEEFNNEENKRSLCLLIDFTQLYLLKDVNFIRTLFRNSRYFQEHLLKRKDLKFYTSFDNTLLEDNPRKLIEPINIEYFDITF